MIPSDFWTLGQPAIRYSLWFTIVLLAIPIIEYRFRHRVRKNESIPIVGLLPGGKLHDSRERFRHDAQRMLLEGYANHQGRPFYIPSPLGERLMIPPKYVEELRNAPIEQVDFVGTFFEVSMDRWVAES